MPYTFPGIVQYVDAACDSVGLAVPEGGDDATRSAVNDQRHRARSGWHLKTVVNAISQLPGQVEKAQTGHIDPATPQAALDRVNLVVKGLEAQLKGVKDAVADVVKGLGLESTDAPPDAASNIKQPRKKGDANP
jgi:hypothetical protein